MVLAGQHHPFEPGVRQRPDKVVRIEIGRMKQLRLFVSIAPLFVKWIKAYISMSCHSSCAAEGTGVNGVKTSSGLASAKQVAHRAPPNTAAVINWFKFITNNHYRFNSSYVSDGLILSDQVMQAF